MPAHLPPERPTLRQREYLARVAEHPNEADAPCPEGLAYHRKRWVETGLGRRVEIMTAPFGPTIFWDPEQPPRRAFEKRMVHALFDRIEARAVAPTCEACRGCGCEACGGLGCVLDPDVKEQHEFEQRELDDFETDHGPAGEVR